VKEGQRVLFHILNGSATENIQLALSGHRFQVVALDGNPVPRPQFVDVLELGTAERISAQVEMKNPGVWILGPPTTTIAGMAWESWSSMRIERARRAG
jgi:FtsP/CotA-like multicopper oxidase with cupredoxin domain